MNENRVQARVASCIVLNLYERLKSLTLLGNHDSLEFNEILNKLKKCIDVENAQYAACDAKDINEYFAMIDRVGINDQLDGRIFLKMKERRKELSGKIVGDTLLSSIISAKIYIDVLKDVDKTINLLQANDTLDIDDIETIKMYHVCYKFNYLVANKFLEKIALASGLDIESMPVFSFEEIEEAYSIKFVDNIQNILYDYIVSAIDELANYETDDKYLLSYISIFEVARVKVMLPYLEEDKIDRIMELYKVNKYSYDKNGALRKVKKLIKKRKEEFN